MIDSLPAGTRRQSLAERASMLVTDEVIQRFERDGCICIRGMFTPGEIDLIAGGIEENLANPGPYASTASRSDDSGLFFEDFRNWDRIPAYREIVYGSVAGAVAARLLRSRQVRLHHDHLLVKEPLTRQDTPWHQDQPYYNIDGRQNISMWIPVDPVPTASTLRLAAGTHSGEWFLPRSFMSEDAKWFPSGTFRDVPDVDGNPDRYPVRQWAIEPGDVVLFHMLTLHGAGGSTSRRRVLSLRFVGDDIRHAPRPWRTSPPFPELEDELPAGAPLSHNLFPIVWDVGS